MRISRPGLHIALLLAATAMTGGCSLGTARQSCSQEPDSQRFLLTTTCRTPPVIDGILDDECWEIAVPATDFALLHKDDPAQVQTTVYVTCDSTNIYFAFRCDEPDPCLIVSQEQNRDASVCDDDCVELFMDLNRDYKNYFHFIVNPDGVVSDASVELLDDFIDVYYDWDPKYEVKTFIGDGHWSVEMAISFSELMTGIARPTVFKERRESERCAFSLLKPPEFKPGTVWNVNLCRRRQVGTVEFSSWAPCCDKFYSPYQFGHLVFADGLTLKQLATANEAARQFHSRTVSNKNAVERLRLKPILDDIDSQTGNRKWTPHYRRNMLMGYESADGNVRIPNYARRDGQGRVFLDEAFPPLPEAALDKILVKKTPRYIFDDKSLLELRREIEKNPNVAKQWEKVKKEADELLSVTFKGFKPCEMQWDRNCVSREAARAAGDGYGLFCNTRTKCALAYAISRDAGYAAKAWEAQVAMMEHFEKYQIFRAASNWYSIWDASYEVHTSTYVYDMIAGSGVMSATDKARFVEFIRRLGYSVNYCVRYSDMVGNHQYMWTGNFGCMVSYFPEFPEHERWAGDVEGRMPRLYEDILADGGQVERSPGHHVFGLRFLCRYAGVRRRLFDEDVFSREYDGKSIEMALDWMAKIATPLGEQPAVNDSKRPPLSSFHFMLDVINQLERGDYLQAGQIDMSDLPLDHLISDTVCPWDPDYASVLLPNTGFAVMRDGWDADSRYLLFDYGVHGAWHGHYDKMNIILYADGEPWVLDAGSSPHYCVYIDEHNNWHKQTVAHNTVLIDGKSQEAVEGSLRHWSSHDVFDLVSASHDGYDGIRHTRTVFHPRGEYFIVNDLMETSNSKRHSYSWLLHVYGEPSGIAKSSMNFTRNGKGLLVIPADPADIDSVELDKGLCIDTIGDRIAPARDDGTWTPGDPGWGYIPYVSVNKGTDADEVNYIVVLYPYVGERRPVVACEKLRDKAGNALGICLQHDGFVDIYGERKPSIRGACEIELGEVATDAEYFFLRTRNANVLKTIVVGGTHLSWNGKEIEVEMYE